MGFYGNVKGSNAVRVFFSTARGLFCRPREHCTGAECGRGGWGKPFRATYDGQIPCTEDGEEYDEGDLINPPYGTPSSDGFIEPDNEQHVFLTRTGEGGVDMKVKRGRPVPIPYNQFDWRGLESSPGKGDFPMLHFAGPHTRYFPRLSIITALLGGPATVTEESTSQYENFFWNERGKQIDGPIGATIRGGCIVNQGTPEAHYVVVTGGDIQTSPGVQFWKRPVNDDEAPWVAIGSPVEDLRDGDRQNGYNEDAISYVDGHAWDVPWHFNAAGTKAIHYKLTKLLETEPEPAFDSTVRYVVDFTLASVSTPAITEVGENSSSSVTRSEGMTDNPNVTTPAPGTLPECDDCSPEPCGPIYVTQSSSGGNSGGISWDEEIDRGTVVFAGDFEWPTDDIIELEMSGDFSEDWTRSDSDSHAASWQACGNGPPSIECNSLNQIDIDTMSQSYALNATRSISITNGATWNLVDIDQDEGRAYSNTNETINGGGTGACPPGTFTSTTTNDLTFPGELEAAPGNGDYKFDVRGCDLRYKVFLFEYHRIKYINPFNMSFSAYISGLPGIVVSGGGWIDGSCNGPWWDPCQIPDRGPPRELEESCAGRQAGWASRQFVRTMVRMMPDGSIVEEEATMLHDRRAGFGLDTGTCDGSYGGVVGSHLSKSGLSYVCSPGDSCSEGNYTDNSTYGPARYLLDMRGGLNQIATKPPALAVDRQGSVVWSWDWSGFAPGGYGFYHIGAPGGLFHIDTNYGYEGFNFEDWDLVDVDSAVHCSVDDAPKPAHGYHPLVVM